MIVNRIRLSGGCAAAASVSCTLVCVPRAEIHDRTKKHGRR